MEQESSRNMIIFMICALVMVVLYNTFVMEPIARRRQAEAKQAQAAQQQAAASQPGVVAAGGFVPVSVAVNGSPRVKVETPALSGSIALRGARIDDLYLKDYHLTVDPKSAPVEMFRPQGAEHAWSAQMGWTGANVAG